MPSLPVSESLAELAQKYQVNSQKTFFPVNSLRLLYFIISDYYTESQLQDQNREKIGSLIPKVEAVFAARMQHRSNNPAATPETDWQAVQGPLQDVYAVIDTPVVRNVFAQLFSYLYPLQDEAFLNVYQQISSENPVNSDGPAATQSNSLTAQTLSALLSLRAMDSVIFSTLLAEILLPTNSKTSENSTIYHTLHFHLNIAYQINDLVDAIVFAKDDMDANNFSPFQVIRKVAPQPATAKELIHNTLANLRAKTTVFAFPASLQENVELFYNELIGVVSGEK